MLEKFIKLVSSNRNVINKKSSNEGEVGQLHT